MSGAERAAVPAGESLSDDQKLAWLRLIRSQNIGPATFRDLIDRYGTADAALEAVPELLVRSGSSRKIRIATKGDAEGEMTALEKIGATLVCLAEPDYPAALRAIDAPPPVLAVRGNASILQRDFVAFVGSRNASVAGHRFTQTLAAAVGKAGYGIVSGLARGIDAAAHLAAVESGTVAVFAGGVDVIYPHENRDLAKAIHDKGGALISEMPLGWKPRAQDFPRRNRIVAGMALGLVVVEAAKRSGSLISARLASEAGRQVFAVPGSPLDPRSEGTNHLIRDGAQLVTSADEILRDLEPLVERDRQSTFRLEEHGPPIPLESDPDESDRARLRSAIGHTPTDVDELAAYTGIAHGALHMLLLEMDLAGDLERHSGNRVSLL